MLRVFLILYLNVKLFFSVVVVAVTFSLQLSWFTDMSYLAFLKAKEAFWTINVLRYLENSWKSNRGKFLFLQNSFILKDSPADLSDYNGTRAHNHLVHKRTLNHLAKLALMICLNGWVFLYELIGCGFESRCSHLNLRYRACFEQEIH